MALNRRRFLVDAGVSLVAGTLAPGSALADGAVRGAAAGKAPAEQPPVAAFADWSAVRAQFELAPDYVHLSTFYLAPHPRPVRDAIEAYRRALDANPYVVLEHGMFEGEEVHLPTLVKRDVASYLGGRSDEIALTGSTTMGLALLYNGLRLRRGDEILTTLHDHYAHHESIRLAAEKQGAVVRKIALFDSLEEISEEGIVGRVRHALRRNTRVVGITWVHSGTGVKLPVRRIAQVVREANAGRRAAARILLVVDGVHGLGVEDETISELGCDFFVSGTHKWMFGPRGTGIIWGRADAWPAVRPTIPSFESNEPYAAWMRGEGAMGPTRASWVSPGGFHAYEHQWAIAAAFRFHRDIGRARVAERIHALAERCKDGLAAIPGVSVHTPGGSALSAGIVCFSVRGIAPDQVVRRLLDRKVVVSTTPYAVSYARAAPAIMNTPDEIDTLVKEVRGIAGAR